jgi:hypothetical protein
MHKGTTFELMSLCWQYAHVNATSTMGWVVVTGILCWITGHSTVPMTNTLGQTILWSGCVYCITTRVTIASTSSTGCWKLNLCESLAPSYVVIPIGLKVGCTPILNVLWLDSKQELVQMYSNQQPVLIERA